MARSWNLAVWSAAGSLLLASTVPAATPTQTCQRNKNNEAGKYALCRQKAEGRFAVNGDAAARTLALQRCLSKFDFKWPALEAKAVNAGATCPSMGDQAAIEGVIGTHTTTIAAALAGGALVGAPLGQRIQTGQTTCHDLFGGEIACTGTGQDGALQKGLDRAYVDNGDGTITDTRTGLMWEKLSDDGSIHDLDDSYIWGAPFTKIDSLNAGGGFAGYDDWRMPNVNELQSLVHYGDVDPAVSPAFDTGCVDGCTVLTCSCTHPAGYWTSTTGRILPSEAWFVDFSPGGVHLNDKEQLRRVRAVRGGF